MTRTQSTLAVLTLYFICVPAGIAITLFWLAIWCLRRGQFYAGALYVRFMAATDPNQGGA